MAWALPFPKSDRLGQSAKALGTVWRYRETHVRRLVTLHIVFRSLCLNLDSRNE